MSLKYLTKRTAVNATTKNPALCNFNHLRSIPRTWLIRRSKNDPKLKSVRVADRIKFWNIVPGDQIRLRGDEDNTIHEVLSINRLSNRVFLAGSQNTQPRADGKPPPGKNVHYSRCQLFIGDFELPRPGDPTGIRELQAVFALRVGTSAAVWSNNFKRYVWRRYAVATIPKFPGWHTGQKIRIPWPPTQKRKYPEAGMYDTPKEDVARVTYKLPTFGSPSGPIPELPAEEEYLNLLYNPHLSNSYGESLPFEVYLDRELANPHSRAKKLERFRIYQANTKLLLNKITAEELRNLDGRNVRQAKADAAFKWREQVEADKQKKKKVRWMHSARTAELERKASKRTKKDERKRRLLTELVLKKEPNQFIPKSQN